MTDSKTHLGKFLTSQYKVQKTDAKEMAARMDVDATVLSRIKKGRQVVLDPKTLRKFIIGISDDRSVRQELIAAYLCDIRDNCPSIDPAKILIEVIGSKNRIAENTTALDRTNAIVDAMLDAGLKPADIDDFVILVKNFNIPDVRRTIHGLASMISRKN